MAAMELKTLRQAPFMSFKSVAAVTQAWRVTGVKSIKQEVQSQVSFHLLGPDTNLGKELTNYCVVCCMFLFSGYLIELHKF